MIKINSRIFYFLLIPSLARAMDVPPKRTNTILWLTDSQLLAVSPNICSIRYPISQQRTSILHNQPTYNIVLNKDKKKAGLFCQNFFVIYDIPTRKRIGSLFIDYSDNYSVAFGPKDEIILYHHGKVTINNQRLHLPLIEHDTSFGISCNHRTKEIMYPSSNNTFTRKSLINADRIIRYSRIINDDSKTYTICSAFYSPYGPHIALHTREKNNREKQKIFLLNSMTNNITKIMLTLHGKEELSYYHAQFLPHASIIAVLCTHSGIHFYDFVQQQEIGVESLSKADRTNLCRINDNVFDINSNVTHYAATIQNSYFFKEIPPKIREIIRTSIKDHNVFIYWFLHQYSKDNDNLLPKDIINILMNYMRILYNM